MITFAERLRSAMREANINQAMLAEITGISKGAVSGYVSGKINPPDKKKAQIAAALGKPEDFFKILDIDTSIAADGSYRMPVELAAALMNVDVKTVRIGLQNGTFPFGYAIKNAGSTKYTYWISRLRFAQETGIPVPVRGM